MTEAGNGEDPYPHTLPEMEGMMYGRKDNDSVKDSTNSQNVPGSDVLLRRDDVSKKKKKAEQSPRISREITRPSTFFHQNQPTKPNPTIPNSPLSIITDMKF